MAKLFNRVSAASRFQSLKFRFAIESDPIMAARTRLNKLIPLRIYWPSTPFVIVGVLNRPGPTCADQHAAFTFAKSVPVTERRMRARRYLWSLFFSLSRLSIERVLTLESLNFQFGIRLVIVNLKALRTSSQFSFQFSFQISYQFSTIHRQSLNLIY